jgi:hypothetical protein
MLHYALASSLRVHDNSSQDGSERSPDSPENNVALGFQPVFCSQHRAAFSKYPSFFMGTFRDTAFWKFGEVASDKICPEGATRLSTVSTLGNLKTSLEHSRIKKDPLYFGNAFWASVNVRVPIRHNLFGPSSVQVRTAIRHYAVRAIRRVVRTTIANDRIVGDRRGDRKTVHGHHASRFRPKGINAIGKASDNFFSIGCSGLIH